jgi:hypothetical protein
MLHIIKKSSNTEFYHFSRCRGKNSKMKIFVKAYNNLIGEIFKEQT